MKNNLPIKDSCFDQIYYSFYCPTKSIYSKSRLSPIFVEPMALSVAQQIGNAWLTELQNNLTAVIIIDAINQTAKSSLTGFLGKAFENANFGGDLTYSCYKAVLLSVAAVGVGGPASVGFAASGILFSARCITLLSQVNFINSNVGHLVTQLNQTTTGKYVVKTLFKPIFSSSVYISNLPYRTCVKAQKIVTKPIITAYSFIKNYIIRKSAFMYSDIPLTIATLSILVDAIIVLVFIKFVLVPFIIKIRNTKQIESLENKKKLKFK